MVKHFVPKKYIKVLTYLKRCGAPKCLQSKIIVHVASILKDRLEKIINYQFKKIIDLSKDLELPTTLSPTKSSV